MSLALIWKTPWYIKSYYFCASVYDRAWLDQPWYVLICDPGTSVYFCALVYDRAWFDHTSIKICSKIRMRTHNPTRVSYKYRPSMSEFCQLGRGGLNKTCEVQVRHQRREDGVMCYKLHDNPKQMPCVIGQSRVKLSRRRVPDTHSGGVAQQKSSAC